MSVSTVHAHTGSLPFTEYLQAREKRKFPLILRPEKILAFPLLADFLYKYFLSHDNDIIMISIIGLISKRNTFAKTKTLL